MNQQQQGAAEHLALAIAKMVDAGPQKFARIVTVRMISEEGLTNVRAVIFAETEAIADKVQARLAEPSQAELLGLASAPQERKRKPPIYSEAKYRGESKVPEVTPHLKLVPSPDAI